MEVQNEEEVGKLVEIAYKEGVPEDQLRNFLVNGYVPLPWQLKFHSIARLADKSDGPTEIGVGGARGPGKSYAVFAQVAIDDCQRIPNLKGLFLRQTGKAAQESFEDFIFKVLANKVKYQLTRDILKFPNGSRVLLGGFENERDIDKYVGIEYDVMAIEELNQLTKDKIDRLKGSLRTPKTDWRPRIYSSFNPGGIGHQFVKDLFVIPFREKEEQKTRFVPANYRDNIYLNIEYVEYLEGLVGDLGKAWREGNWDLFEGQYFGEWNQEKHTVRPFRIPDDWRKFGGLDFGRTAPFCFKWYAIDYNADVWVYKEYYRAGLDADKNALNVVDLNGNDKLEYVVADSSIFSKLGFAETIAEVLRKNGIGKSGTKIPLLIPSSKDRVAGWQIMHQYLWWDKSHLPKIHYFETCRDSIRTIPTLIYDEHRPEDLDSSGEDHAADTDRYFLQTLRSRKTKPPLTYTEMKVKKWKEKYNPPMDLVTRFREI